MVMMLIQEGRLLPIDDPRLRYNLVLQAFEANWFGGSPLLPRRLSKPVTLREGQTLVSTHLSHLVMDDSEHNRYSMHRRIDALFCAASIEIRDSPPPESSSTVGNLFVAAATAASIIGGLDVIARRWKEKRAKHNTQLQIDTTQTSESEIMAIRLQMTDGTEAMFQEWLTDPGRLKHYIDIFFQPSTFAKPVEVVFALKNGKTLVVDVSEGAQNNLQLNELLSYLNIDSVQ